MARVLRDKKLDTYDPTYIDSLLRCVPQERHEEYAHAI